MFVENVVYRPDSERGVLDIMLPEGAGPFPAVLCIHGGAWSGGDKSMMHPFGEEFLKLGIASLFPNYRLTGTHPHPAQEQDIFAALEWAAANAERFRLDVTRFGITGASAGGHLTALVGLKATKKRDIGYTIRCMAPVCPPTDFFAFSRDNPSLRSVLEALVGGELEKNEAVIRDVSPIFHVHEKAPPCLVTHGAIDSVVPPAQATSFVDALKSVGVEAEVILVPGVDHAAFNPGTDPPEPLGGIKAFRAFYRKHLLS